MGGSLGRRVAHTMRCFTAFAPFLYTVTHSSSPCSYTAQKRVLRYRSTMITLGLLNARYADAQAHEKPRFLLLDRAAFLAGGSLRVPRRSDEADAASPFHDGLPKQHVSSTADHLRQFGQTGGVSCQPLW